MGNPNPYLLQVRNVTPRLLALFDTNPLSISYGIGDRYRWAWKLIDFGNGTFQGAAHGLARLLVCGMLNEDLTEEAIIKRIEAIFKGTESLIDPNGSLAEAFPFESSFCVTALVAYDLLTAVTLLDSKISDSQRQLFLGIVRPLIRFLHKGDESHAFISNHLATASAALYRWSALTNEDGEDRGHIFLERILKNQSAEGWFKEYEGADPGYQSLCLHYLADLHLLRPDLDILQALRRSIRFLLYFAHPDGSFGGLYGSRNTRFYFPSGIEALTNEIPEAIALADFMRRSISQYTTVTLSAMDDSNLIPMFNSYCWAASLIGSDPLELVEKSVKIPALSKAVFRRHYPEAGMLIDKGDDHYTVVSLHKGGVCYHFKLKSGLNNIFCGVVAKDLKGHLYSTQSFNTANDVRLHDDVLEITASFIKIHRDMPTPFQFLVLRLLSCTLLRVSSIRYLFKKAIVRLLITGKKKSPVKNIRRIQLGFHLDINDEWKNNAGEFTRVNTDRPFSTIHMASQGYWQKQDDGE